MRRIFGDTFEFTAQDASLPVRDRDAHKGNFGRVLIVAGSVGFTGAPTFAARAAVRCGAGLVFLAVPEGIYQIEAVKNDEAMVFPLPERLPEAISELLPRLGRCDACLVGPGMGLSEWARELIYAIIENSTVPLVVDADGITAVSRHIDILDKLSCPLILTPHEGEFARLSDGLSRLSREEAAREFAVRRRVTVVLKGHRTVTASPDGRCIVNTTGNPGMATGGAGDVLAGMILALLGQGMDPERAASLAVWYHGAAGDWCEREFGQYAMTPTDMTESLKYVLR